MDGTANACGYLLTGRSLVMVLRFNEADQNAIGG